MIAPCKGTLNIKGDSFSGEMYFQVVLLLLYIGRKSYGHCDQD